MKIGLILASNIKLNPYINIFTKILDEKEVDYDIISWDREGLNEQKGYVYQYHAPNTRSKIGKLYDYYKFYKYSSSIINSEKYDKLIVFGAALGVFMYDFLKKKYSNKFWFDYRDLTIEQKFMGRFEKLLNIASYTTISSPGFKEVLPMGYDYILSHNFDIEQVRHALDSCDKIKVFNQSNITVSTIGSIRDYVVSVELIDSLKNNNNYSVNFIGKGPSSQLLSDYVRQNSIENVYISGYYDKKDESDLFRNSDIINIYLPKIPSHSTPMANRFYNALINKKPMIVTTKSTQAYYIEKYNLGISVDNCLDISNKIEHYLSHQDPQIFYENTQILLKEFLEDYNLFSKRFNEFINE